MALPMDITMPSGLVLSGSWTVEWDAINPTTGATVAGVKITHANIVGTDISESPAPPSEILGPFMLVPGPDA